MAAFTDYGITIPTGATGEVDTPCPECSPSRKNKSATCLSVNVEKQFWLCHHCGWKGSVRGGIQNHADVKAPIQVFRKPAEVAWQLPDKVARWLLEKRGITRAVAERNQVGYTRIWMPQIEERVGAVYFPYRRDGELINRKWRDHDKHFRMEKGAERILYKIDDMADVTIICEGELDALSCEVAGFPNAISVPDGAPSPNSKTYSAKFTFLDTATDAIQAVKRFILALDNDEPGKRLEEELARRLGPERCDIVTWPLGCKDANEVLVRHGADALREAIEGAKAVPVVGMHDVDDLMESAYQYWEGGTPRGQSTGWITLDRFYTVRPGEFTVVTGIPGSGKSTFLDNLAINMAGEMGWPFAICSPENAPLGAYVAKHIGMWLKMPIFGDNRVSKADMEAAREGMEPMFSYLLGDEGMTLDWILERAKIAVFRKGIRGLIIDPWNEIDHKRSGVFSETEYISESLTRVRRFARTYGVHVWLVAHPTKLQKDNHGNYPIPTPYDISGSAHWRNKADYCITVHREIYSETPSPDVDIHIQKARFQGVGRVGCCTLVFDERTQVMRDKAA